MYSEGQGTVIIIGNDELICPYDNEIVKILKISRHTFAYLRLSSLSLLRLMKASMATKTNTLNRTLMFSAVLAAYCRQGVHE